MKEDLKWSGPVPQRIRSASLKQNGLGSCSTRVQYDFLHKKYQNYIKTGIAKFLTVYLSEHFKLNTTSCGVWWIFIINTKKHWPGFFSDHFNKLLSSLTFSTVIYWLVNLLKAFSKNVYLHQRELTGGRNEWNINVSWEKEKKALETKSGSLPTVVYSAGRKRFPPNSIFFYDFLVPFWFKLRFFDRL